MGLSFSFLANYKGKMYVKDPCLHPLFLSNHRHFIGFLPAFFCLYLGKELTKKNKSINIDFLFLISNNPKTNHHETS